MKNSYSVSEDVIVKNENGTSHFHDGNCGSWLQHWKNYGGNDKKPCCCIKGCSKLAEHGAHVTRPKANDDYYKTHLYIVPMCAAHNGMHGEEFTAVEGTVFVRANQAETCGKKCNKF